MHCWLASVQRLGLSDPEQEGKEGEPLPTHPTADPEFNASYQACITHRFAHDFAGRLPNLADLYLLHFNWAYHPPHPSVYVALSQFPAVHTLVLQGSFPTLGALCHALSAFPSLRDVSLNVNFLHRPSLPLFLPGTGLYRRRRPALTALKSWLINGREQGMHLFQWLSHTPTRSSLQKLDLSVFGHSEVRQALAHGFECAAFIGQVLRTITLCLFMVNVSFNTTTYNLSALASCQSLQKLSLVLGRVDYDGPMPSFGWASFWAALAESFAQLCPAIREIPIRFNHLYSKGATDHPERDFGDGIEALEPVFERAALAGLQDVLFDLYIRLVYEGNEAPEALITLDQVEDAIKVKSPKFHKRGIARVKYEYDARPVLVRERESGATVEDGPASDVQ